MERKEWFEFWRKNVVKDKMFVSIMSCILIIDFMVIMCYVKKMMCINLKYVFGI